MIKAAKFRLYPNAEQRTLIQQTFGCARKVYNLLLEEQNRLRDAWLAGDKSSKQMSYFTMTARIVELKKIEEFAYLRKVDKFALEQSAKNLHSAVQNWFSSRTGRRKGKQMGWAQFKTRHSRQSYRTQRNPGTKTIELTNRTLKLSKLGHVRCVVSRQLESDANIKSVTVSLDRDGRYYASICYETNQTQLLAVTGREVGIDLGLKDLIITSDRFKAVRVTDLKNVARTKQQIKKKQKQLARKQKSSKNYEKKRLQLARLCSRATCQRSAYYHDLSRWLIDSYDSIYLEDLNISGMLKNRSLSRAIHESAWSDLLRMILYKADWAGRTVHQINRFFASSKTCSCCGHENINLTLDKREWVCDNCHTHHDRDINAALNILQQGQIDIYTTSLISHEAAPPVPTALMKLVTKTEKSDSLKSVDERMELSE